MVAALRIPTLAEFQEMCVRPPWLNFFLGGAPWEFLQQCTLREDEVLGIEAVGADWTIAFEGAVNLVPQIVAGERYMAPRQWCDLGEQRTGDGGALVVDEADGATKIDGVP